MGSTKHPFELDRETMRELGYRVIDLLVERFATLAERPVRRGALRGELDERLREPPPTGGASFDSVLERLARDVLPYAANTDHPRFLAFIPSSPTWPAVLGDLIATGHNIFQGVWLESAGASAVELVVLDWFKEWLGYPPEADGLLVSGGSAANLTAVVCAREALLGGRTAGAVVYVSTESHSSVARAARVAGFLPDQLRVLPVDAEFRISLDSLEAAVSEDARAGRRPFLVAASAGATSSGAVDPLTALSDLAVRHGFWLHVDAAYGGFAVLTERGRRALGGIALADSVTLDPHKWLYQPYDAGCLLVRDGTALERAFRVGPDYLQDTAVAGAEVNFSDRGIELTRRARALKIWLSLQIFGVEAFREAIDRCLDLALAAESLIEASPELELLSPARLGVVCFRRRPRGLDDEAELERLNAGLQQTLLEQGRAMISSTRLDGRYALRLCILGFRTRLEDVEAVLRFVATHAPGGESLSSTKLQG